MLPNLMPALTRYADSGDIVAQEAKKEIEKLRAALDRIAFCGSGEDYRVLREIARTALETTSTSTPSQ